MSSYQANIRKMYIFRFLLNLHFMAGVLIPFYIDWGGITFQQIMILQSFFVFATFALEIPTGAIADYFGRKTSIIIAGFVTVVAALIYSSYPSFYIFMIGELLWALGRALMSGADEALVYDSLKKFKAQKQSKKVFGRFASFEIIGIAIAGPIGSIIAVTLGLRYTMMLIAVPMLIATFIAFSLKEPKTEKKIESRRYLETLLSGVRYFRKHRILKILAFDKISIAALIFLFIWFYQPLLKQLGVPLFYYGFVLALIAIVQLPFLHNLHKVERIFGSKKRYLLFSAILAGFAYILLGAINNLYLTLFLIIIIAGFGLTRYVLFQSYMNNYIESPNRATVISTVSMLDGFSRGIIYPIFGLMIAWSLNYTIIILGIVLIILALISRVKEEHLIG